MNEPEGRPATDVVVVGAGFAGLYGVHRAHEAGLRVVGIEAAQGVGGTWYWNRYPGARCDVESIDYSYSFDEELQQEWRWSERYATQPEILAYLEHVAERFDLARHFRFGQRVTAATYDDASATWLVESDAGEQVRTRYVVFATGSLSAPNLPDIPGIEDFAGTTLMTSLWPEEGADLTGKRVGVIGTGSSGIQSVPLFAEQAASLTVFQRSPNFSVPAFNRLLDDEEYEQIRLDYAERRRVSWASTAGSPHVSYHREAFEVDEGERNAVFEEWWTRGGVLFAKAFPRLTLDPEINRLAREFAEKKIRAIVTDPQVADDLVPVDHPIGTKRICTDSGYFESFNRDNVRLVNLRREPISAITSWGIKTTGASYELDVLICATGFDAMTGALTRIDITGARGARITEAWRNGPLTYLGLAVPGFPNMFNLNAAGSPSVLVNMALSAEQHVEWVMDLIGHADRSGFRQVEARQDAAEAWNVHLDEVAQNTLFVQAPSWYMGANIAGKPVGFMPYIGGFVRYIEHCTRIKDESYSGFVFTS
jgi:cation diffusion facilitator CzcD-associated flavoprotein CzcO